MKIYGAGSLEEIEKSTLLGASGILTNPQGFDQYFQGKASLEEITRSIIKVTDLPVFIQIHGSTAEEIVNRGLALAALSPQVGFKIISDEKGFKAMRQLQREGIRCIATALFSLSQAAVAAAVGVFGICFFVSRARAIGMDPHQLLSSIKQGYSSLEAPPEIVAVSMKGVGDVDLALSAGADAVGMRYPLIQEMMTHPLSQKAEVLFGRNWARVKGENVDYLKSAAETYGLAE